jgi:hypothetical protein
MSQTEQRAGRGGVPPPQHTKWKKGCASPNPKGRLSTRRLSDAAKTVLAEVDPKTGKSGAETLAALMFRRAKQGSIKAAALLLAYAEGKPAQNVNVSGGVLHAHTAYRPLATLTDEEVEQLAAIRKRLSGPAADEDAITVESAPSSSPDSTALATDTEFSF